MPGQHRIYLDNAATQPMRPEALDAMKDAMEHVWGNASAMYRTAAEAKSLLERSREQIAMTIGAEPSEIYFTSGGTESDNWALTAGVDAFDASVDSGENSEQTVPDADCEIITTAIEHHAVLRTCDALRNSRGAEVTLLSPDAGGRITPEAVIREIRRARGRSHIRTAVVSVMMANNEIGTIEPVREIGEAIAAVRAEAKAAEKAAVTAAGNSIKTAADAAVIQEPVRQNILFHTDAVQAYGKIPIDVRRDGVDLMSASAHKIGGPKGIGFLYIRRGVPLGAFIHGGLQERGRRAGTENVPAAAGFAAAATAAMAELSAETERERKLQRFFLSALREAFPDIILNGPEPGPERLPNNINISIPGAVSDSALIALDLDGIEASGGSACTTGALSPSHVLTAIGADRARAKSALRFTLGPMTTEEDLRQTVASLQRYIQRMHAIS